MTSFGWRLAPIAAVVLAAATVAAPAQQAQPASIHGHVQNAVGQPVPNGEVRLTTDRNADPKTRKYQYTFPLDANGDYKGTGIAPGSYAVIVFQKDKTTNEDKSVDFQDNIELKASDDKAVDFDMSRPEYINKMTPEERKQLEEYKKKNADVSAVNAKIADLNKTLVQARADTKAGNFDGAISSMTQATTQKPDEATCGARWAMRSWAKATRRPKRRRAPASPQPILQ